MLDYNMTTSIEHRTIKFQLSRSMIIGSKTTQLLTQPYLFITSKRFQTTVAIVAYKENKLKNNCQVSCTEI